MVGVVCAELLKNLTGMSKQNAVMGAKVMKTWFAF
jgi:hypothetical protein